MVPFVDTHSHVHFAQFDNDRDVVLSRMREQKVITIAVGTHRSTSAQAVALQSYAPDCIVGATIGVHPSYAAQEVFDPAHYDAMRTAAVVGIGECGLDYFKTGRDEVRVLQTALFEAQIQYALTCDLPLMLHVRPSKGSDDAHQDALALLSVYSREHGARLRGTAHFFTGSLQSAQGYWDLGFCTSFPGVITFAPETHEVVREAPEHLILSETDAPYAAPVPYRGTRAEPVHVIEVAHAIASIRNTSLEDVQEMLFKNAMRVFLSRL